MKELCFYQLLSIKLNIGELIYMNNSYILRIRMVGAEFLFFKLQGNYNTPKFVENLCVKIQIQ